MTAFIPTCSCERATAAQLFAPGGFSSMGEGVGSGVTVSVGMGVGALVSVGEGAAVVVFVAVGVGVGGMEVGMEV